MVDEEVEHIWTTKTTGASALYLATKYITLLDSVLILALRLYPITSDKVCQCAA